MPSAMKKALLSPVLRWEPAFTRQLFRLAVPIALQSVVTASMQLVDNLMIGVLGDVPLAGVTQANRVSFPLSGGHVRGHQRRVHLRSAVLGPPRRGRRAPHAGHRHGLWLAGGGGAGIPSILMPESIMRLLIQQRGRRARGRGIPRHHRRCLFCAEPVAHSGGGAQIHRAGQTADVRKHCRHLHQCGVQHAAHLSPRAMCSCWGLRSPCPARAWACGAALTRRSSAPAWSCF